MTQGIERVIRSDFGVAHRLSLSARVLSAVVSQVKAKRQCKKRLWRLQNRHAHEFQSMPECLWSLSRFDRIETGLHLTGFLDANRFPPRIKSGAGFRLHMLWCTWDQPNHNITRVIYPSGCAGARGGGGPEPPGERTQPSPAQSSSSSSSLSSSAWSAA